ncbi:MAG: hypothetical protein LBT14_05905 [Treponema sp.]|jgi:uncharacterized membrane protein YcgQ (UPF0703/DUF1980 family)|nr:hypothetical protein [Treponema sp.]
MKRLWILLVVSLFLAMGCSKQSLSVQRNNAGTRSVTLPGNFSTGNLPENPDTVAANNAGQPRGKLSLVGESVEIKEKLFIAQTNEIYLNPEDYMGKTIKLEGLFKTQAYTGSDTGYHFVLRYGPGCCGNDGSAGFEVAWDTPEVDYPPDDQWVEVVGVLDSYEEEGYPYLYLSLSSLTVKEDRGAEFVSQ